MTRARLLIFGLLLAALVAVGLMSALRAKAPTSADPSSALLKSATSKEIRAHARKLGGRLVLINFWASWCGPCKDEFPSLLATQKEFAGKGLKLLLVSLDEVSDFDAAEAFLKAQGVDFPSFYKGSGGIRFITDIFPRWSGAVPANVLLGPDLAIKDAWEGQTSAEEFRLRILKQLGER